MKSYIANRAKANKKFTQYALSKLNIRYTDFKEPTYQPDQSVLKPHQLLNVKSGQSLEIQHISLLSDSNENRPEINIKSDELNLVT